MLPKSDDKPGFIGSETINDDNAVIIDNADQAEQVQSGKWIATGNINVHYKGYRILSDRADIDTDKNEALFSGHVKLTAPTGETMDGGTDGTLRINLQENVYVIQDSKTIVPQSRMGIGMILPLHLYGGTVMSKPGMLDTHNVNFTTCNYPNPHYHFQAKDLYFIPNKKLVAKHVRLYRRNKQIISLPYLIIPLDHRDSRLTPVLGQSPDEGYFAKFAVGYLLVAGLPGLLRIDLMEKKGVGTGFDQSYGNSAKPNKGSGMVTAYHLPDKTLHRDTISGTINHRQNFGDIVASINAQAQQNSYLISSSKTRAYSEQLSLMRNKNGSNTMFSLNNNTSDYGSGSSQNLSSSLDQTLIPSQSQRLHFRLDYSDFLSSYTGSSKNENAQLNSNIDYSQQLKHFDWQLAANKYTLVKSTSVYGFYGGLEKLPELKFATDSTREDFIRRILTPNSHLDFTYGDYNESTSKIHTKRYHFGLDLGSNTLAFSKRTGIDYSGSFQQSLYGDDTAQYILMSHTAYKIQIGKQSTTSISYDYLRPYGYTPFQFDVSGNTNLIAYNLAYQESPSFMLNVSTGYDINIARQQNSFSRPTPWQTMSIQSYYRPTSYFSWRQSASFDINHGKPTDFTDNFKILGGGGQQLNISSRFSPDLHRFTLVNGLLDLPIYTDKVENTGWRLQSIGGYNGTTNRFDYSGIAVTRSWHDWEASFVYENTPFGVRPGDTFTFNFRLKAFGPTSPFSAGQLGQSLEAGIGPSVM